jgi:hypothetical protein
MKTVESILAASDREPKSMRRGEKISVDPDSEVMMSLVIEKVGESELSVGHYYRHSGTLMSDPEVIFEISDRNWTPVRFVQDPDIERDDPGGLDIGDFLDIWDRNLRRQGYVEPDG